IVSVVTLVWGISPRQPSGKNIIRWLLKKRTNGSVRYCQYTSPFFVDAGNKKLVFWFVRVDDEGYPEIARCTEREFATILSGISAGGMYCPECGTVHWPDGVAPPF
ncbi:hypothetical protein, partial [Shigella sonnei]